MTTPTEQKIGLRRGDLETVLRRCGYDPAKVIEENAYGEGILAVKVSRDEHPRLAEMASWLWNAGEIEHLPLWDLWDLTFIGVEYFDIRSGSGQDLIVFPYCELVEDTIDWFNV